MWRAIVFTITLCCLGNLVSTQVISFGKCPTVNVQKDFNITKYLGRWYEQERFFAIFEAFQNCVSAEYTPKDAITINVNNTGFNTITKRYKTALGDAQVEDPKEPAKLGVRFSEHQPRGDYWVLSTDYDDYSVVWSCGPVAGLNFLNVQFGWILTRHPEGISDSKHARIYSMLENYGINTNKFSKTNQSGCPGRQ